MDVCVTVCVPGFTSLYKIANMCPSLIHCFHGKIKFFFMHGTYWGEDSKLSVRKPGVEK